MTNKSLATIATENEITSPADHDFMLYAIDSPTGSPVDAGIRPVNLFKMFQYLTTIATVDVGADSVVLFDASAGTAGIKAVNGLGLLAADGSVALTSNWDVGAFSITALSFASDVPTGTAPLTVASTTLVANLNADKLDGTDVNDAGSTTSDLWTASKIQSAIDTAVDGRSWKDDVRCRATANVDLAGGGLANGTTHDGVTVATGDRVACFNQSTGTESGVYVVPATGAASRSTDFAAGASAAGFAFRVTEGTTYGENTYYVSSDKGADVVATHTLALAGGGSGETNTASSIGGGAAVFKQKTGVDLEFRSISGVSLISASLNGDVVEVGLAGGTDGELITWDASGNPATVAVGTAGQVLTSNGPGAAPTFQAAGAADNLGNHTATQDLVMTAGTWNIDSNSSNKPRLRLLEEHDTSDNYIELYSRNSGSGAEVRAKGDTDANVRLVLRSQGSERIHLANNVELATIVDTNGNEALVVVTTASAVDHWQITNAATGNAVVMETVGDTTNISGVIKPKGTGDIEIQKQAKPWHTLTDGATITIDGGDGDSQFVTLGGNRTIAFSSGSIRRGQRIILRVKQDGTGSRELTWDSGIKWSGDTAPTLTTAANQSDYIGLLCIDNTSGSEKFAGFELGLDYDH